MSRFTLTGTLLAAATIGLSGCGSSESTTSVQVAPVAGYVTWQGKPVAGADVTFFNADVQKSSFGRTDDKGFYQLTTVQPRDGATIGKHTVTVSKVDVPVEDTPVASIDSDDYVPPGVAPPKMPKKTTPPKALIPEKFASQSTTTLTATVEAGKNNEIDLKLD